MADQPQTFKTHRRFHPIWHFFAFPVLLANVFVAARHTMREPNATTVWALVVAAALVTAVFAARVQTLIVQNRLIRLEMRLHLRDVIPAAMHARIAELSVSQLIGLRFGSDAELPELVDRCLKGELTNAEAVKKAVKNWRADHVRA
jgi:hypothetical protein